MQIYIVFSRDPNTQGTPPPLQCSRCYSALHSVFCPSHVPKTQTCRAARNSIRGVPCWLGSPLKSICVARPSLQIFISLLQIRIAARALWRRGGPCSPSPAPNNLSFAKQRENWEGLGGSPDTWGPYNKKVGF